MERASREQYLKHNALDFFQGDLSSVRPTLLVAPTTSLILDQRAISGVDEKTGIDSRGSKSIFSKIDFYKRFTALPRYAPNYGLLSLISTVKEVSQGKFPIKYVDLFALGVDGARSCRAEIIDDFEGGEYFVRFGSTENEFRKIINREKPKIVGINCFTSAHHNDAVGAAKVVREETQDWLEPPIIIIGGTHPTYLDDYFASHKYFDIVVRGEGEITFLELLAAIYKSVPLSAVKGITYQERGRIYKNPDRPLLDKIGVNALPPVDRSVIPRIDGVEITTYYGMWHQGWLPEGVKVTDVQTSRGCMVHHDQCRHCVSGHLFGPIRRRSTGILLEELKTLAEEGYEIVSDISDQALYPIPEFREFCRALVSEGINESITLWTVNGLFLEGLKQLPYDDKRLMVEAGYRDLCISIEGGPGYIRDVLNKPIDVRDIETTLTEFRMVSEQLEVPVVLRAFFMVGGPGCTLKHMKETEDLAQTLVRKKLLDQVIPFIATPVPGAAFFDETIKTVRRLLSDAKGKERLYPLFPNSDPAKKAFYRGLFEPGNENDIYRFFETNYIWPRLRYGIPSIHSIYGISPESLAALTARMSNLTLGAPRFS